jgi:hypothetical protein
MAVNAQELGHRLTRLPVPTGQQIQHLQPWFLPTVMFTLSLLLQAGGIFANDRESFAHRLLSSGGPQSAAKVSRLMHSAQPKPVLEAARGRPISSTSYAGRARAIESAGEAYQQDPYIA